MGSGCWELGGSVGSWEGVLLGVGRGCWELGGGSVVRGRQKMTGTL